MCWGGRSATARAAATSRSRQPCTQPPSGGGVAPPSLGPMQRDAPGRRGLGPGGPGPWAPPPRPLRRPEVPSPKAVTDDRTPVAFFGVCDLKYDPTRARLQRIWVLEIGNGKSSRFSGHGEEIPRAFEQSYRLVRQIDRAWLTENKKMQHDVFAEAGFGFLRPAQACFPRKYTPRLASRIATQLDLDEGGSVVLKLLNRCRGAGVVVARSGRELDAVLQLLLATGAPEPQGASLPAALASDPNSMEEQCAHWWSNECPVFVAESCEESQPVLQDGQPFDGTMRVGFVLCRRGERERRETALEAPLSIHFLGAYWKLPSAWTGSNDARARCVSKARSGTAPVSDEDFATVCTSLHAALPAVFAAGRASTTSIALRYGSHPLLYAYSLARQAAELVRRQSQERARGAKGGGEAAAAATAAVARGLLAKAEEKLAEGRPATASAMPVPRGERGGQPRHSAETIMALLLYERPEQSMASYIQRQRAVLDATAGDWDSACGRLQRVLELHPWNATAEFLLGTCHARRQEHEAARGFLLRAVQLDPDFKAVYINLGASLLNLRDLDGALAASEAGLRRYPQAFQCSYHLGLALCHKTVQVLAEISRETGKRPEADLLEEAVARAAETALQLRRAKEQKEQRRTDWEAKDDELLGLLEDFLLDPRDCMRDRRPSLVETLDFALDDMHGWLLCNYRP